MTAPSERSGYVAFVSYNHADRTTARWLHRGLETFRVPRAFHGRTAPFGRIGARIAPVFMDREELSSSPDLAASVRDALERSEFLVVICSPQSARSRWVNEEVRHFKSLGREDRILTVVAAGIPRASRGPDDAEGCFPPALANVVEGGVITDRRASEPLAADLRTGADPRQLALLKIVAALLGVPFDELRRREQVRRQRRLAAFATVATIGCVVLGGLALAAWLAREEAERQRRVAEQQSLTAQRTAQFLKSLFRVSDPTEARGNSITAREILDRGARQLSAELQDEPLVRADLATTLGEVYTSLGLYRAGRDLLTAALDVPGQPPASIARRQVALAAVEHLQGRYAEADALYARAAATIERVPESDPAARVAMLRGWGETLTNLERHAEAREKLDRAARLAAERFGTSSEPYAEALEGQAYASFFRGDLRASEREFSQALAIRRVASGDDHPRVLETLNQLGAVEYMLGDRESAARYMRRSLDLGKKILGPQHADLAPSMNNLGRLELERRRFAAAEGLLEEALALHLTQKDETNDHVTFALANLAIARAAGGRLDEADALYARALRSAIATKHRLHGPILTDWADLDCRRGRVEAGLRRLDEAGPIVAARYPDDPWRAALVDSVRAGCETRRRRYDAAERLLTASNGAVFAKWRRDTLYGYDAFERNVRLYELTNQPQKLDALRRSLR